MANIIKHIILLISKYFGFFHLCKLLYKNRIRILCYHGFSIDNEEKFVPGLFIKPDIFDQRMKYLKDHNFNVISLEQAYQAVKLNDIAENSVVITIDDGFYSTYKIGLPILKKYDFPSTLYLTSYYFDKDCPIFGLATKYIFWNSAQTNADFSTLDIPEMDSETSVILKSTHAEKIQETIIQIGQAYENDNQRIELLKKLAAILGQDYQALNKSRILNLINQQELDQCIKFGMDIELHTHRHKFPVEGDIARYEIEKNKERINPLLPKPMSHFCYPSGDWSKEHWPILEQQNIKTSTTCDNGLITIKTPFHAWSRYLDSARMSQLEFEAELSGFNEVLRKMSGQ